MVAGEHRYVKSLPLARDEGLEDTPVPSDPPSSSLSFSFSASFIIFSNFSIRPCRKQAVLFLAVLSLYSFFLFFLARHQIIFCDLYIFFVLLTRLSLLHALFPWQSGSTHRSIRLLFLLHIPPAVHLPRLSVLLRYNLLIFVSPPHPEMSVNSLRNLI